MKLIYSLLLIAIQPLVLLRLLLKSRHAKAYRQRIPERYGFAAPLINDCIWVHAVSVGEAITAKPVVDYLLAQHPNTPLLMTTTTPTGAERVVAMFGDRVIHRYMPQDIPCSIQRLITRVQPKLIIIMETELWPNLVAACAKQHVPVVLANGRLSSKSAQGYARFGTLTRRMLKSVTALCVQTQAEQQRFIDLGADIARTHVMPSLKFEADVSSALRQQAETLIQSWQLHARFVWIAASTHAGEDEIILAAHKQLLAQQPNALLILVPRHPERFDSVASLCESQQFSLSRWSLQQNPIKSDVLLVDAMGQLMHLYGVCDAAFVGGSLNGGGGHNILEPALWAKPVLSGPGLFNFKAVSDEMATAGGLNIVNDEQALVATLLRLQNSSEAHIMGTKALAIANKNKGGLAQLLAIIDTYL